MLKFTKLAGCVALICTGLITQVASAATVDRNFFGGACTSEAMNGVIKGPFVCDDDGKTVFLSVADVYSTNVFRVTHIYENKKKDGGTIVSIIVEKK